MSRPWYHRPAMALLEVEELSVFFGGLAALSRVSLMVERGEIVGLIGPNGAGKTTLFNAPAGVRSCIRASRRPRLPSASLEGYPPPVAEPIRVRNAKSAGRARVE